MSKTTRSAEAKATKNTKKKASKKSQPKNASLRATVPASVKTWITAEAKKREMTQSEFVSQVLQEKKSRSEYDFVGQIQQVIREEFAKLQKNLQSNIQLKVVNQIQEELDEAVENAQELLHKSRKFIDRVANTAKANIN